MERMEGQSSRAQAGRAADLTPGISGVLFGVGAYPLLATFFAHAQRALLR